MSSRGAGTGGEVLRNWLPVAVWLGLIALESTSLASAENTGSWLKALFQMVLPGAAVSNLFDLIHFLLRKGGHFLGYGVLGVLFFRALRRSAGDWNVALAAGSVVLTAAVASLDELHQSFIPSRTGSVSDVALDTCGAVCLLILNLLYLWIRLKWSAAAAGDSQEERQPA